MKTGHWKKDKVLLALPIISTKTLFLEDGTWEVYFYEEYSQAFFNETGGWKRGFVELLNQCIRSNPENNFRTLITTECIQFLAGFFFNEKEILLATPRASRELFLVESLEKEIQMGDASDLLNHGIEEDFRRLKDHIQKISSLDPKRFPSQIEKITIQHQLPDLLYGNEFSEVYKESKQLAKRLLKELNKYRPTFFERVTDFSLNLTANYPLFRVHLLRFLAILPSLDYDQEGKDVKRIFLEAARQIIKGSKDAMFDKEGGSYKCDSRQKTVSNEQEAGNERAERQRPLPSYLIFLFKFSSCIAKLLPDRLFAYLIRRLTISFARRFIAGETIEDAREPLFSLKSTGRDATIDQLGELVVSEKEADSYCQKVINLIKGVSSQIKRGETNPSGILRANVSVKVSALSPDFKPEDPDYTFASVAPRLRQILLTAKTEDVFINVDAEHYRYRDIIFTIFKRVLLETEELHDFKSVGIALQAYLRDAYAHFLEILELAKRRRITMPIRLVKGAYWDAETIEAQAFSFDAPEFLNKEESDISFRQLTIMIMGNYPHVQLCLGSHNLQDNCFAEALRMVRYPNTPEIEHQCLYMTCESLSISMSRMSWVTRNYVPVGSLLMGMGYLVRRIMENSSLAGVLTIMRSYKKQGLAVEPEELFKTKKKMGKVVHDHSVTSLSPDFVNISPVRLYLSDQRTSFTERMRSFQDRLGQMYEQQWRFNGDIQDIHSPSDPDILVGRIRFANKDDAMLALEVISKADQEWAWDGVKSIIRASILLKAADALLLKRLELASLIVYEGGKCIPEALADVDEAIDFINFYAREEVYLCDRNPHAMPRGVFVVISPWNFPLSIPCGMVSASLVAGNVVLLKSSKQTPLIAQELVNILIQSGIPEDVLIHIPCFGDDAGTILVEDTRVNGIVFTGSKATGTWIARQAGKRVAASRRNTIIQVPLKVITEMGGKNAIVVTANAELDETVSASIYSCFGHAGQKCSAASRILVDERILDRFIDRFKEACFNISIGESNKFATTINPVICAWDKQRLIREGREACREAISNGGKVHVNRIAEDLPGYCVGPLVIQIPAFQSLVKGSYSRKELFGPIVHIIPFNTLDQAIQIVNSSEYALTGAIFSQSQEDIEYLIQRMQAGNLYINRGCTGARVSIEPFGGFKLSGTGPKAGSRNYVPVFHLLPQTPQDQPVYVDVKAEESGLYQYNLAQRSWLGVFRRIKILKRWVCKICGDASNEARREGEGGVDYHANLDLNESERAELKAFIMWLDSNLDGFLHSRWPNRYIPGQLSYNDHSMIKEQGLVIAYNPRPHRNSLYNLISAMAIGAGITILVQSQKAFACWKSIYDSFIEAGLPSQNLSITIANEDILQRALRETGVSFIIIDGNSDKIQDALGYIFSVHIEDERYMRSIHTPFDSPQAPEWEGFLLQFVFVRSVAINTIRYGAALELE